VLATLAFAALGLLAAVAAGQEGGEVVFDPDSGQYLSFAPCDPGAANSILMPDVEGPGLVGEAMAFGPEGYGDLCDPMDPAWWGPAWTHRFSLFAGVHGFKGPSDLGRNGNFGFHEGINFGAPLLESWGYGYQVGFQATHSNFKGDRVLDSSDDARHQIFLTAGVFKRVPDFGFQSAVVFDFFHDDYYDRADLKQIRSETSLRLSELREIGYFGAYNVGGDQVRLNEWFTQPLKPEDLFAVFYRRYYTGGGQGRVWGGMSGTGDFYVGAETTVPMGTNWALENNFAYLLPKEGRGAEGQGEEIWAVSIQLVWYPGRPSRCVFRDPYQPMLNVADNSVFMVGRD